MPLYLEDNEEWALLKLLTLIHSQPAWTSTGLLEALLEVDRRCLLRVQTMLEKRKGQPEYLR